MLKITVTTSVPEKIARAIADMDRREAALLQELGQELLSLQRLDFEVKSRGGTGIDGTKWKPLAESTLLRKARKSAKFRANEKRVRKLKAKLKTAKTESERKGIMDKIRAETAPVPQAQIGVDTGIMRNCVVPGYKAPDGDGGNILEIRGSSVTVGYAREYVPWFDEGTDRMPARPIMPNTVPAPWQDKLEKVVSNWLQDITKDIG